MNPYLSVETYLAVIRQQDLLPRISVQLAEALLAVTLTDLLKEKGYEIIDDGLVPVKATGHPENSEL